MKKYGILFIFLLLNSFVMAQNQRFEGKLLKKPWSKSTESYCSQGSDYFVLQTKTQTLVLDFGESFEKKLEQLKDKQVVIEGKIEKKVIKSNPNEISQRPINPFNQEEDFSCEVLKIQKIDAKTK